MTSENQLVDDNNDNFSSSCQQRPRSTYPFGKCKVCYDKATGIHYGIATCEGCKGFFKRSTQRTENYICMRGNICKITPKTRNQCKACRFRKCLLVGMSIDGVKMGRIPKAEKEKALIEFNKQCQNSLIKEDLENKNNPNYLVKIIQECFIKLYSEFDYFDYNQLVKSLLYGIPNSFDLATDTKFFIKDTNMNKMEQQMSFTNFLIKSTNCIFTKHHNLLDNIYLQASLDPYFGLKHEISGHLLKQKVVEAYKKSVIKLIYQLKQIVGLNELPRDDFVCLLKTHSLGIFMILHSKLLIFDKSYLMMNRETCLTRDRLNYLFGESIVNTLFEFSQMFNALNLTNVEISLLVPLVITCPNSNVKSVGLLHYVHESFTQAFNQILQINNRSEAFIESLNKMILFFPRLRELVPFIFKQIEF